MRSSAGSDPDARSLLDRTNRGRGPPRKLAWFSRLSFTGITRGIGTLGVGFDIRQAKIGGLEFLLGVELRLIEIVLGLGIGILTENENGPRFYLRSKIDHADEGMAGHAVAAFLILFRPRIKVENNPNIPGGAGY